LASSDPHWVDHPQPLRRDEGQLGAVSAAITQEEIHAVTVQSFRFDINRRSYSFDKSLVMLSNGIVCISGERL
jgi:hypothetical protein